MEILALYKSEESLVDALAAGARHLAATLEGLALIYPAGCPADEPNGWAGFTCAQDAQSAGSALASFRREVEIAERSLLTDAPEGSPRIWQRAAGGVYGFPLRLSGDVRGVAIVGCPGPWPRVRNAEIESILRQITLVLDHHALADPEATQEPSDELLELSEKLLVQDMELVKREEHITQQRQFNMELVEKTARELRRPLAQMVELLMGTLANEHEKLGQSARDDLRRALDNGNAAVRTVQHLLDLCLLKQGAVEMCPQDVNLAGVLEEMVFEVRDSVAPGVALRDVVPPSLPKIRTDLGKLSQLLYLLVDNAVKFTRAGSVEVAVAVECGEAVFTVTDTGIGISAEDQSRIFEAFFQVDVTGSGAYTGSGLGLALAAALADHLGGTITVRSDVGRGATFTFRLPATVVGS